MLLIVCLYFRIKSNMIYLSAASVPVKLCSWDLHLLCRDKQVKLLLLWHLSAQRGVSVHEQTHSAHYIRSFFLHPVPLLLQSTTDWLRLKGASGDHSPSLLHKPRKASLRKLPKNHQKRNEVREGTAAVPGHPWQREQGWKGLECVPSLSPALPCTEMPL